MRVLVTGATGFIGNHLCSLLSEEGYEILALVRPGSDIKHLQSLPNLEFVFGDINTPDSLVIKGDFPSICFHLAADWGKLDPDVDKKFIRFLINSGLKKIVFYSSVCAAGLDIAAMPLDEEDIPQFIDTDFYGKYKYAVEQFIISLKRSNELDGVILRPTLVYGPGDTTNIFSLIKAVRLQRLSLWEDGKRIIAPCYVKNLNRAALLAATGNTFKEFIYNIADGENLSTWYVTKTIAEKMGVKHHYSNHSVLFGKKKGFLMFVLNRFGFTNSFATHFAFNSWTRSYDVYLKRLYEAADRDMFTSFEEAIEETLLWYYQKNRI